MVRKNLLRGFKKPKGITFEHSEVEANYGRFVAYPFERGYGVTIGNTLRRILLSSIQGYAISAVKITTYREDGSPWPLPRFPEEKSVRPISGFAVISAQASSARVPHGRLGHMDCRAIRPSQGDGSSTLR